MSSRMNVDHLTACTVPDDGIELLYDADSTNTPDSEDSMAQFQTVVEKTLFEDRPPEFFLHPTICPAPYPLGQLHCRVL